MSNIVIPEAPNWSEDETRRYLKILEDMGLKDEIETVKKLRSNAKRRGDLPEEPSPRPAGEDTLQETKGK